MYVFVSTNVVMTHYTAGKKALDIGRKREGKKITIAI